MKLEYGMVIEMNATPIKYVVGGIGVTSSSEEEEKVVFTIEKYYESDFDANRYKVKLVPTDEFKPRFGNEKLYSIDLISMLNSGTVTVKQ